MDVHVDEAITRALRTFGLDILTAQQDGSAELEDDQLLSRATELGRVLFTQDNDFLTLTYELLAQGIECQGVIYAHQTSPIGMCVEQLHLAAETMRPDELANRCLTLPLC